MTNNLSNLRIGHLNVRGLERHIDGIKLILDKNQYHFFATTETKLKSSSPVGPIRIPGYNLIKHTLPSGRGRGARTCGGVGLYVQKGIKAIPFMKSSLDADVPLASRFEFLAVHTKLNDLNICVVVVYNPSCSNPDFSNRYEKLLLDLLEHDFDRLYIVGDFNINITASQPSTNLCALQQINAAFNLSVLPTGPTRITENSATTIDLLITDSPGTAIKSKTTAANTISDHEVVYLLADIRVRKPVAQTIRVRNMRGIDQLQLQASLQSRDMQLFYETTDINTKTNLLSTELKSLLNQFAPEKDIVVQDQRTPWITAEIKQAVALRDLAFSLYRRNPNRARNDPQWQDYTRKRDRVNSLIFVAKIRYSERHFSTSLPARKLWSNLRREGIHNSKKNTPSNETNVDDLNHFFAEGHMQQLPANQQQPPSEPIHRTEIDHGPAGFRFQHTNVHEVCRKIYEIQTNAAGTDDIPISFIKVLCPFILPLLSHLFNAIIDANEFPVAWKKGIITPIPKCSNPIQPKDFRPISVLPAISKVLEKILLVQITEHLSEADPALLARNQSGYRKGFSTTTALTKVVHDIYSNFDDNRCTVMV